ncbi:MAG TPA: hypothetical protein VK631_20390 [Solirubrobacteraceae bacterium]|nr:hypothetical protein [Solirubrobacteraceae bacterium]
MPLSDRDVAEIRGHLSSIDHLLPAAILPDPGPTPPVPVSSPGALDRAILDAADGALIYLAPELIYEAPLILRRSVHLIGYTTEVTSGRQTFDAPAARFLRGIATPGAGITLAGLELWDREPTHSIVENTGAANTVHRCRLLGDPVRGQRRGIAANGANGTYTQNYIGQCFATNPGPWSDSQAICAWDTPGPIRIIDNYLEGSSEGIMIGGSDPSSSANDPADVAILSNMIFKPLAWNVPGINCKNGIEFKNCRRFTVEDNDIVNSFGGHGQDGYFLVLNVRNQGGRNPTASIQDGTISGNRFKHGPCAINILGIEDIKELKAGMPTPIGTVRPSVRMRNIEISGNLFEDLDPAAWYDGTGAPKLNMLIHGAENLSIVENDFQAPHGGYSSVIYFAAGPRFDNFVLTGNRWPRTTYGIFGTGVTVNAARDAGWKLYATGTLASNTEVA